jgi:two-component system NtrC family sensor kinase
MDALGQLTGGVAHDFNNLLTIISGRVQTLRRRLSDPKLLDMLDAVDVAVRRGANLTRQLLTFSRRQQLNPEVIDLREHISYMRPMLRTSLPENIEIIEDIAPDLWLIEADAGELDLAILNLALNARDVLPEGGRVRISGSNVTSPKTSAARLEGDFVALSLSDNGPGIAPDHLSRIFEPFFTTKPVGKGTGLGLSQVFGFTHQSGGTVTVASEIGRGTTIRMYLPRSNAQRVASVEPSPEAPTAVAAGRTILVVEDDPMVATATAALIEQLGHRSVRADSAAKALEILTGDHDIDLVFSDVVMPGAMNGIELAHAIRKLRPDIPVILTSGYSGQIRDASRQFEILPKPLAVTTLDAAIRHALAAAA